MPHGTVSGYLPVQGGRIYFEVAGMGPHLFFIHGFTLDRRIWDDQWDYFRGSYTCVRYDVRAHGRSDNPQEPWADHDDVMLLMAHLGIEQAILCGLSLGGGIALDVAVAYPHAVRALALLSPAAGGYYGWSTAFASSLMELHLIASTQGVDIAKAAWLANPLFDAARLQPDVMARVQRIVEEYSGWEWLNEMDRVVPDPQAFERLHEVKAPTLVLTGEFDLPDFQQQALLLADGIRDARHAEITDAGHLTCMEEPTETNRQIQQFLANLPSEREARLF